MNDITYAIGPNGTPIEYSGSARPPADAETISEVDAKKLEAEMLAADAAEISKATEQRQILAGGAFTALTSGIPLTVEQAKLLGARPLAE